MTEKEFDAISYPDKMPINWEERTTFLKNNGYKITRDNILNGDLSHKDS